MRGLLTQQLCQEAVGGVVTPLVHTGALRMLLGCREPAALACAGKQWPRTLVSALSEQTLKGPPSSSEPESLSSVSIIESIAIAIAFFRFNRRSDSGRNSVVIASLARSLQRSLLPRTTTSKMHASRERRLERLQRKNWWKGFFLVGRELGTTTAKTRHPKTPFPVLLAPAPCFLGGVSSRERRQA